KSFLPNLSHRIPEIRGINEYMRPPTEPIMPTRRSEAPIKLAYIGTERETTLITNWYVKTIMKISSWDNLRILLLQN
ncbi:hypothetical protein DRN52_07280, partial [Thermococci archaeon]